MRFTVCTDCLNFLTAFDSADEEGEESHTRPLGWGYLSLDLLLSTVSVTEDRKEEPTTSYHETIFQLVNSETELRLARLTIPYTIFG